MNLFPLSSEALRHPHLVRLWRAQFAVLLTIATYLSLVPKPGALFETTSDKLLHLLCWSVLLVSLRIAVVPSAFRWRFAVALFGYSVLVELGQMLVPNRIFSGLDIVANAAGILIGCLLVLLGRRWIEPQLMSSKAP